MHLRVSVQDTHDVFESFPYAVTHDQQKKSPCAEGLGNGVDELLLGRSHPPRPA